jgi:hypothetical protein
MNRPTEKTLRLAEAGYECAMRDLLRWWMWNDRNGTWYAGLAYMDGASEFDNPEGFDPMPICREIAEETRQNLKGNGVWE